MGNLPLRLGQHFERNANTGYDWEFFGYPIESIVLTGDSSKMSPRPIMLVGEVTAPPRLRWVAGLRGWAATLGLRHCPNSYGRLQSRIFRNGGNPDDATPRGG